MALNLMTAVFKNQNLSSRNKWVLLALADNADGKGKCWPSVKTLMIKTKLSRATVFRALRDLEENKYIHRNRRFKRDTQISSVYMLNKKTIQKGGVSVRRGGSQSETGGVSGCDPEPPIEPSIGIKNKIKTYVHVKPEPNTTSNSSREIEKTEQDQETDQKIKISIGSNNICPEEEMPKKIGEKDVLEVKGDYLDVEDLTPEEIITFAGEKFLDSTKKDGQGIKFYRYKTGSLFRVWKAFYKLYGHGFCKGWTGKDVGKLRSSQIHLPEEINIAELMGVALDYWSTLLHKVNKPNTPPRPSLNYFIIHLEEVIAIYSDLEEQKKLCN